MKKFVFIIFLLHILTLPSFAGVDENKFVDTETIIQTLHLQEYSIKDINIKIDYDDASFILGLGDKQWSVREFPYNHFVLLAKDGIITLDRQPHKTHKLSRVLWSYFYYNNANPTSIMIVGTFGKSIRDVPQHINKLSDLKILYLHYITGTQDANNFLGFAKQIQRQKLITYVSKNSYVASGGASLLIAGQKRYVEKGGQVQVHAFGFHAGASDKEKQWVFKEWGNFYLKSQAQQVWNFSELHKELYTLKYNELKKYNIINVSKDKIINIVNDTYPHFLKSVRQYNNLLK